MLLHLHMNPNIEKMLTYLSFGVNIYQYIIFSDTQIHDSECYICPFKCLIDGYFKNCF